MDITRYLFTCGRTSLRFFIRQANIKLITQWPYKVNIQKMKYMGGMQF